MSSKLNLIQVLKTGAIASALAFSGLAAQAQGHPGHDGFRGHEGAGMMIGEHMLDAADATDAQRAQIKTIMEAARADLKNQREAGRKLHEQALALFAAPNIDAAAIEALRVQGQQLKEQASKRMSQAMIEAARVLTPEQRAKLAEKMKKRQARMAEHMRERAASGPSGR
jgi:Spy/CpxP family protein refolding chaperone